MTDETVIETGMDEDERPDEPRIDPPDEPEEMVR